MSEKKALITKEEALLIQLPFCDLHWHCHADNTEAENLSLGTAIFPPGGEHGPHRHPNAEEFIYVLKGRSVQTLEYESFEMRAGDCVHIPQNAVHSTRNVGEGELAILVGFSAASPEVVDVE